MGRVDTKLVCRRFASAVTTYDRHAGAQHRICLHLLEMLRQACPMHFHRVLELGCGSGGFTRLLLAEGQVLEWTLNDLCEEWLPDIRSLMSGQTWLWQPGDAEHLDFQGEYDLVVSANALQWMQDLPHFLSRIRKKMTPGGILLFNLFTPNNLPEVRLLTKQGLEYPSIDELRTMLLRDFSLLRLYTEDIVLTFPTPTDVLRHLKYTGVTATASVPWTKGRQLQFCKDYSALFSDEAGCVKLTYSPVYVLAMAK